MYGQHNAGTESYVRMNALHACVIGGSISALHTQDLLRDERTMFVRVKAQQRREAEETCELHTEKIYGGTDGNVLVVEKKRVNRRSYERRTTNDARSDDKEKWNAEKEDEIRGRCGRKE